jgi:hypothetical protein
LEVLFERDDYRVTLLTFDADREEIEEVITFFEAIASERSWQPKDQLRAYPLSSKYFALRVGNVLAGALQFVVGGVTIEGLPCLAVWPELQLQHQNEVADIALLALRKDYRGQRKLFWLLCTEMWRYCVRHNICELWVEATPRVVKIYQEVFGWPLQIEGPLRLQWDEYCYPCKMSVDVIGEVIRARSQKLQTYKQIWEHACS